MIEVDKKIDENALSRQLATYGYQTQGKLMEMKVYLYGINGLGIQIAKNLILAGPKHVSLFDGNLVSISDVGRNFYVKEEHVGKVTRAHAVLPELKQLNPTVVVDVVEDSSIEFIVKDYTCVVVLDHYNKQYLIKLNNACRSHNIGFIYGGNLGVYGFAFVDFGEKHVVRDQTGEQEKAIHIASISQDVEGVVYLHEGKKHGLSDGDTVQFREVQGMEEINGKQFKIVIQSKNCFTIGDTRQFSAYKSGGIAEQIKIPITERFYSLQKSLLYPYAPDKKQLPICSWDKFGIPQQLHAILNGLLIFQNKFKRLPENLNKDDCVELIQLTKEWVKNKIQEEGFQFKIESINQKLVENISMYAQTQISPICSFWGGIITQEIVKFTGKYSPLHQWLHHQFTQLLPEGEVDREYLNTRYYDYGILFGDDFVGKIARGSALIVGAGALGCEFIKMFALMGMSRQSQGKCFCTDDDNIEISNLNRQFLFRKHHIGLNKSQIACQSGRDINNKCNLQSLKLKVGNDSQDYFNDYFWNKLDFVIGAVDNANARRYIDDQCVWYEKPFFQSGTLGTKCHSQIIIPHLTLSYTDIIDPPQQTYQICTVKHFPYQIQHTIQWARQYFEGVIRQPSQDLKRFYQDKDKLLKNIKLQNQQNPSLTLARLETLKKMYEVNQSKSYQKCVQVSVNMFWDVFYNQIVQLLKALPQNQVIKQTQKPYWSGLKRAPKAITLQLNDPLHIQFIQATSNILATMFNLKMEQSANVIKQLARNITPQKFTPKKLKIEGDEKSTDKKVDGTQVNQQDEIKIKKLCDELINQQLKASIPKVIQFQKDQPSNWHIEFMGAVSNLRARNYKIDEIDNFKIKIIAGKIIPAIATTTAMVVGAVGLEIIKYLLKKQYEKYRNFTSNLALPLWIFSQPLQPIQIQDKQYDQIVLGPIKAIPQKFNKWKKIDIKGPLTLLEFKSKFQKEYGIEISMIIYNTTSLYNRFIKNTEERLTMGIQDAIQTFTKKKIPKWKKALHIAISGNLPDGVDCVLPDIKYYISA